MVSTPEGCTNNSPMVPKPYVYIKKSSERKPLRQFTETLDLKHKASVCGFSAANAKYKATQRPICSCQTLQMSAVMQK